mmetsp:Transcript_26595/g.74428  ORF Transcript_26595/g.74428 Transcript_26595/m.74428 type:complete len:166 (+) Transcript_26595:350-847(+)
MVICEYLDDISGNGATYSAEQRAACRLWASLMPGWFAYIAIIKADPGSKDEEEALKELRDGLHAANAFLATRPEADSGPFLLGERFSLAEVATAPFAQRFMTVLPGTRPTVDPRQILEEEGLFRLSTWLTAVCTRPSCMETIAPTAELVESYKALLMRMKAISAP